VVKNEDPCLFFKKTIVFFSTITKKVKVLKRYDFLKVAGYPDHRSIYSETFSIDDSMSTSFYGEILEGVKSRKFTKSQTAEYLTWINGVPGNRSDSETWKS
jgi:hypothetical protein